MTAPDRAVSELDRLRAENEALRARAGTAERERDAARRAEARAREQRAAAAAALAIVAGSPADLPSALGAVAASAARLCRAEHVNIWRREGDTLRSAASAGPNFAPGAPALPLDRGSMTGRAMLERRLVHVPDLGAALAEFPRSRAVYERGQRASSPRSSGAGTTPSARSTSPACRPAPSPTSRSRCCACSPTRPSSPSRTRGSSRSSSTAPARWRSATPG